MGRAWKSLSKKCVCKIVVAGWSYIENTIIHMIQERDIEFYRVLKSVFILVCTLLFLVCCCSNNVFILLYLFFLTYKDSRFR